MSDNVFTTHLKLYPCLWDKQDIHYYNQRKKKESREILLALCKKAGIDITPNELQSKVMSYQAKLRRRPRIKILKNGSPNATKTKTSPVYINDDTPTIPRFDTNDACTSNPIRSDVDCNESSKLKLKFADKCDDVPAGFCCNVCSGNIVGFRYRCVQCAHYSLCAACESRGEHSLHYVLRIPRDKLTAEVDAMMSKIRAHLQYGLDTKQGEQKTDDRVVPTLQEDSIMVGIKEELPDRLEQNDACACQPDEQYTEPMWEPDSSYQPLDIMEALYDNDESMELGREEVVEDGEQSDCEDPFASVSWPPLTHLVDDDARQSGSAQCDEARPSSLAPQLDRSRSPVWVEGSPIRSLRGLSPSCSSTPLKAAPVMQQRRTSGEHSAVVIRLYDEVGNALDSMEHFLAPDQHSLYEVRPTKESTPRTSYARTRGGRRRGRGGRGAGSSGRARREVSVRWTAGDPLTEIYLTDDDVPAELIAMATNVIHQRASTAAERSSVVRQDDESGKEDIFEDAEAGGKIFTAADAHFEWSSMDSFLPVEEPFKVERTGPTKSHSSPYSAFRSYWDDGILEHIVRETNAYAAKISSPTFQAEWVPTNIHEVLVLFSFWMMLGVIRMPTFKSCFSTSTLLETTIFRRMFTRKRYEALMRALHFVDNQALDADRVSKIRPILTHLNTQFQAQYILSKNICIDESLILWKGRLNIRQYIKTKAAKFGIKTFELCESTTGYLWSFFVYTGKHAPLDTGRYSGLKKSTAVVLSLIEPLLNKGYRLFMDNWFNSPLLSRFLKRNGTDCVGTLRTNQQHVPPLLGLSKLKQGQLFGRHSGDVCVMAWQDKKKVTTISTCHGIDQGLATVSSTSSKDSFKPQVVLDYNKYMGGVDLKDQMLEPYLLERKRCMKWYMKLFRRLLNCSILNSRILLESSLSGHEDHLEFRLRLVDAILAKHLSLCPLSRTQDRVRHNLPSSSRNPQSSHWLVRVPLTPRDAEIGRQSRKQCYWCNRSGRKNRKTAYRCEQCNVPLCIEDCFKSYHLSS